MDYMNFDDPLAGYGPVGLQTDGTYGIPETAQQTNKPWDIGSGTLGQYGGSGVLDILKMGIGAWSAQQTQQKMIDYKRVEATNGGAFVQGQPAAVAVQGSVRLGSLLMPLLIVGAIIFVLKK